MTNKQLEDLKEQLPAALATWQQSKGSRITVGWMHAANPEVIATLLTTLEATLATPVRLPERYSVDCGVCEDPNGPWLSYSDVVDALREQGVKVESEKGGHDEER